MGETALLLGVWFCAQFPDSGIILNGGFDESSAPGLAEQWELFVQPHPGAHGRIVNVGPAGNAAAMLQIETPYSQDPANNWSQILRGDFSGRKITVSGRIRTEQAGEAALWVQCFSLDPLRVLAGATSSQIQPMSDNNDWKEVSVGILAPENTDFIVVRCVLRGQGTAWFDDIGVHTRPVDFRVTRSDLGTVQAADGSPAADVRPYPRDETVRAREARMFLEAAEQIQAAVRELARSNEALLSRIQELQVDPVRTRSQNPLPAETTSDTREAAESAEREAVPVASAHPPRLPGSAALDLRLSASLRGAAGSDDFPGGDSSAYGPPLVPRARSDTPGRMQGFIVPPGRHPLVPHGTIFVTAS